MLSGQHLAFSQNLMTQLQNPANAAQFLKNNNIPVTPNLPPHEIVNMARNLAVQSVQSSRQLNAYKTNLVSQQSQQGLLSRNALVGGGQSPAPQQASIPFNSQGMAVGANFSATGQSGPPRAPTEQELKELNERAIAAGGKLIHPSQGSHSLQDYQNQLMVLERQNKKRLHNARQEPNSRPEEAGGMLPNGQFSHSQQHQGLQPGHPQLHGTNMSPSNSHTGPSPRMQNMELGRQQSQKNGSRGASPESQDAVANRNPSPFPQQGGMTQEQYQAMMGGPYGQGVMMSGGQQFIPGRPPQMSFGQPGQPMMDALKQRMPPQPGQPGQAYPPTWPPQQMMNRQMNPVHSPLNLLMVGNAPRHDSESSGSASSPRSANAPSRTTTPTTRQSRPTPYRIPITRQRPTPDADTR
jgi:hypothetical protein